MWMFLNVSGAGSADKTLRVTTARLSQGAAFPPFLWKVEPIAVGAWITRVRSVDALRKKCDKIDIAINNAV